MEQRYPWYVLVGIVVAALMAAALGAFVFFAFVPFQPAVASQTPAPIAGGGILVRSPVASTPTNMPTATLSAVTTVISATPEMTPTSVPTLTATDIPTLIPTAPVAEAFTYTFPVRGDCDPYSPYHHDYPATDIFCPIGSEFVAPTSGMIDFVNSVDLWDATTDVPADRGGIMLAMIGDDGVRYYGSHLSAIVDGLAPGARVETGQILGWTGNSGNAASTPPHLHFGISRPTTPDDWQTRRGEVPPYEYLQAWQRGENVTPVLPTAVVPPSPTAEQPAVPAATLDTQLAPLFDQSAGTFGVLVSNTATGTELYRRNADMVFPAASLIKLPIAITVYDLANQGVIDLNALLTTDAGRLVGGTGTLQYEPLGRSYTVRDLCARMIYDSDNMAANMLIEHIGGFAPVNQRMQQIGATQTVLQRNMMDMEARAAGYDNFTSPADMHLLVQQISAGVLPDATGAQEIYQAMFRTTDRSKLPALLPGDVVVAHKVGSLDLIEHDAGVMLVPGQPGMAIVVLSQDLASNQAGITTIARAAEIIYGYVLE